MHDDVAQRVVHRLCLVRGPRRRGGGDGGVEPSASALGAKTQNHCAAVAVADPLQEQVEVPRDS